MSTLDRVATGLLHYFTTEVENTVLSLRQARRGSIYAVAACLAHLAQSLIGGVMSFAITTPSLAFLKMVYGTSRVFIQKAGNTPHESKRKREITVASWNVAGIPFCRVNEGLASFEKRVKPILDQLQGVDVVMLQEVFGKNAYKLSEEMQKEASKAFYARMGIRVFGLGSGLACITLLKPEKFFFQPYKTSGWGIQRGFAVLDTAHAIFIGTHLESGDNQKARQKQMGDIKAFARRQTKPIVLMGDFNVGDSKKEIDAFKKRFENAGFVVASEISGQGEKNDFILIRGGELVTDSSSVQVHKKLSDHPLLKATIHLNT